MDIAIVAPSPIPFVIGGAEKLFWGLIHAINNLTPHKAELIKVPCNGADFWGIIDASIRFTQLDLSHFDLVIATKDPAWCIKHHNIYIYMQHKCRGLYDLYHLTNLPTEWDTNDARLTKLKKILDKYPRYDLLPILFEELLALKKILNDLPQNTFAFPGPLTRKIIHWIDDACLSLDRVNYWAAISQNITKRENYFPKTPNNELPPIRIIHHPSDLKNLKKGDYKYIFTTSRLETLKRIHILIDAYKELPKSIKKNIPFYICGTGGQENNLKLLARNEENIHFLGFLPDEELVNYYSNAFFVPFIPYDEDYGLITVEAMKCAKPVVTSPDSGGVTELVKHEYNGLIVNPEPKDLARAFEYLINNKDLVKTYGENAIKTVEYITWENTVNSLLHDVHPLTEKKVYFTKKSNINNILILNNFPVYPPITGGQKRVYFIAKELSKKYNVKILSIDKYNINNLNNLNPEKYSLNSNLIEIRIPRNEKFHNYCIELQKELKISSDDIAVLIKYDYLSLLIDEFNRQKKDADIVILSHLYLYPLIKELWDKEFIYDAHNVEYELKKQLLSNQKNSEFYLSLIYENEKELCHIANFVLTCSEEDKIKFNQLYQISQNKLVLIPNGVNSEDIHPLTHHQKNTLKYKLGINGTPTSIFIGSYHKPNYDCLSHIIQMANENSDILFLVLGSVCAHESASNVDLKNLHFLGELDENEKNILLLASDIGLNPITSGSGTNLKLVEYACAGLLCLSTPFGARGFTGKDLIFIEDISNFSKKLKELKDLAGTETASKIGQKLREFVVRNYDWSAVTRRLIDLFG